MRAICDRAEGHPYFARELVRSLRRAPDEEGEPSATCRNAHLEARCVAAEAALIGQEREKAQGIADALGSSMNMASDRHLRSYADWLSRVVGQADPTAAPMLAPEGQEHTVFDIRRQRIGDALTCSPQSCEQDTHQPLTIRMMSLLRIPGLLILVAAAALKAESATAQGPAAAEYRTPIGECAPFLYGGWEPIGPGEAGGLQAVRPHPSDADIVIAGSDSLGIQLSRDGGKTWRVCNKGIVGVPPYFNTNAGYPLGWHPTEPGTCYATHAGGVYMSTDGGESWAQHQQHTPLRWPPVLAIAFDPADPNTIYVLHVDGQLFVTRDGCRSYQALGPLPLGDGQLGRWRSGSYLAIDPASPRDARVLYAACTDGLARSVDGGATWTVKPNGPYGSDARNVLYIPDFEDGRDAVVAAFATVKHSAAEIEADRSLRGQAKFEGGVYVSFDEGDSWLPRNQGLPVTEAELFELLSYHPSDPKTLYVGTVRGGGHPVGAYRSVDGGRSWRLVTRRLDKDHNMEFGWFSPDVADLAAEEAPGLNNLMVLEISPVDPQLLFIRGSGHCGLMRSADGGESWHQIYCDPVPGRPGCWRGRGANLAYGLSVGFDPSNPDKIYLGQSDFGSLVSDDGGRSFRLFLNVRWYGNCVGTPIRYPDSEGLHSLGNEVRTYITRFDMEHRRFFTTEGAGVAFKNDVFCTVVDPADSNIVYCTPGLWLDPPSGAILRSTDGARSYTILGPHYGGLPDTKWAAFSKIALDERGTPSQRRLYVAAGRHGVYRSDDAGDTWVSVSQGIPEGEIISDLALCAGQPETLYAASGSNMLLKFSYAGRRLDTAQFGHLFRTDDAGQSWRRVFDGPADIRQIVVHPTEPDVCYLAAYQHGRETDLAPGGVHRTTDGGKTWRHLLGQPTASALVMRPDEPGTVYVAVCEVATDSHGQGTVGSGDQFLPGIYRTRDGGDTWEDVTGELRGLATRYLCLGINPADPEVLYVGCTGGFWRKRIP